MKSVLPDILGPDLSIVFCGSAAGAASARAGHYYAGPGNRFWPILHATGLTPLRMAPRDFPRVREFGIGLTDLNKREFGADADLTRAAYDVPALRERIAACRPRVLAFNGLAPARAALARERLEYGLQSERFAGAAVFVLPSTSGSARRFWDERPWRALAAYVGARRAATDT